jgi:hypothetical protein
MSSREKEREEGMGLFADSLRKGRRRGGDGVEERLNILVVD